MATEHQRKVLLTGASSGIGLETAKLLTARGCEVWGTSRDLSRLPTLSNFHPVRMDLEQTDSIRRGFTEALREAGGFDVLINNAGAGAFGPLTALPADLVREQFAVLVDGPIELVRLALPSMRERGRGRIINVTSLAAQFPIPFMAPYSAAKAALSSFTQTLRIELSGTPIRVVEIRPGDIRTKFHDATNRISAGVGEEQQRAMAAVWETQLRDMAAAPPPERVAGAILRAINAANPPPLVVVGGFFRRAWRRWERGSCRLDYWNGFRAASSGCDGQRRNCAHDLARMRRRTGLFHRLADRGGQFGMPFPPGHEAHQVIGIVHLFGDGVSAAEFDGDVFLRHHAAETIQQQRAAADDGFADRSGARPGHDSRYAAHQLRNVGIVGQHPDPGLGVGPRPNLDLFPRLRGFAAEQYHRHVAVMTFERFEETHMVVGAATRGAEQQNEFVRIEPELVAHVRTPGGLIRQGIVKMPPQQEPAGMRFFRRHAPAHGRGAGLGHRADEQVRRGIDPVAAEPVAAGKFAAIGDATHLVAKHHFGVFKKTVIERVVHAEQHVGPRAHQHIVELLRAERFAGAHDRDDFEEIVVDLVQDRRGALDPVVQPHAESVEPV